MVWDGAVGYLVEVEYAAYAWVNPDQQLIPKTQAAAVLPREAIAYEGVTLPPAMVRRRDGEVVCRVPGCGKTVPLERMQIHIAFHRHSKTLLPPCYGFCGDSSCILRMHRVKGGGATGAAGFVRK